MIIQRCWVQCDQCGDRAPARARVKAAREKANEAGFRRHEIPRGPLAGAMLDLCAECRAKAGIR